MNNKQVILNKNGIVGLCKNFLGKPVKNQTDLPQKSPYVLDSSLLSPQSLRELHT